MTSNRTTPAQVILFGPGAEELIKKCDAVKFELSNFFSKEVVQFLETIGSQFSAPSLYLGNTILPSISLLLGDTPVIVSGTWCEPTIIWTITLGMKSSGKSPIFQYDMDALTRLEDEETEKAKQKFYQEHGNDQDNNAVKKRKLNKFKPIVSQFAMNGGTYEGLQDIMSEKQSEGLPAAVCYKADEFSTFFSNIESNKNFKTNVLSFYTAKKIITNTRKGGQLSISKPLVQISGFTQHETFLRECSKEVDMGGQNERFLLVAPPKVKKDRAKEREASEIEVPPLYKVLHFLHGNMYNFNFLFNFRYTKGSTSSTLAKEDLSPSLQMHSMNSI